MTTAEDAEAPLGDSVAPLEDDYYAILNVSRAASGEEVKEAYRRACIIFHPDKHPDAPETVTRGAIALFNKIATAHAVLSDARLRRIYDEFGTAGIQRASQVVPYSARAFERMQRELRDEQEGRSGGRTSWHHETLVKASLDATPLVDAWPEEGAVHGGAAVCDWPPKLASVVLSQAIEGPLLGGALRGALGATAATASGARGTPVALLTGSLSRALGTAAAATLKASLGDRREVTLAMTGAPSPYGTTLSASATIAEVGGAPHPSASLTLTQPMPYEGLLRAHISADFPHHHPSLAASWRGALAGLAWREATILLARPSPTNAIAVTLALAHGHALGTSHAFPRIVAKYRHAFGRTKEHALKLRIVADIATAGPLAEASPLQPAPALKVGIATPLLSPRPGDRTTASILLGGSYGVALQFSLKSAAPRVALTVPIVISSYLGATATIGAIAVPSLLAFLLENFVLRPYRIYRRQEYWRRFTTSREGVIKVRQVDCALAILLMRPLYERRRAAEEERSGLVILEATYGPDRQGCGEAKSLDVTIPLQMAVVDSHILFNLAQERASWPPGARGGSCNNAEQEEGGRGRTHQGPPSMSNALGFFDVAIGRAKVLTVSYTFGGALHRAVVADDEPFVAPLERHRIAPPIVSS